ncbi:hypothetical protein HZ326_26869 [Fusarium oxysporum f. sp. albedinis]|nr:hypothetical protein HZ326_26869 [Fusarium oxysporum f. sp. albedinis]
MLSAIAQRGHAKAILTNKGNGCKTRLICLLHLPLPPVRVSQRRASKRIFANLNMSDRLYLYSGLLCKKSSALTVLTEVSGIISQQLLRNVPCYLV